MDSEVVYFEPSPLDSTSLSTLTPPAPHGGGDFILKFEITDGYARELSMEEEEEEEEDDGPEIYRWCNTTYEWQIQKDAVIQQQVSLRFTILEILCAMNVPKASQSSMVDRILACALDMATQTHTTDKVLAMFVEVVVTRPEIEDPLNVDDVEECDYMYNIESEEDEEGVDEDDYEEDFEWIPTASSSIEGLERVKLGEEERSVNGVCTICLEDFAVDLEAIRMPCLHMFHWNCIVDWLQKTNSCPLCRFTMPTTDEFGC